MSGAEDIQADTLFVGLTRPATVGGIPYFAFMLEFMFVTFVFLGTGKLLYLVLGAPMHGVLYLISAKDPGIFASLSAWIFTSGKCRNRGFWGAASFSPLADTKRAMK